MTLLFKAFAWSHALATIVVLCTLPIPLLARKGGRLHRRAGWAFVAVMAYQAITGIVLAAHAFAYGEPAKRAHMPFFFLIGWLTLTLLVHGIRALRFRKEEPRWTWPDLVLPCGLMLLSLTVPFFEQHGAAQAGEVGTLAISELTPEARRTASLVFSGLSLWLGGLLALTWIRPPRGKAFWFRSHLQGMIGAAIGGLTGLMIQLVRYVPPSMRDGPLPLILLLAPSVLGSGLMIFYVLRYRDIYEKHFRTAAGARMPPGPTGSLERLRVFFQLWRNPPEAIRSLSRTYGPLTWAATGPGAPFPGILFVADPSLARTVLIDADKAFRLNDFITRLKIVTGNGLLTAEGPHWLRQRRLTQPAFHHDALSGLVPTMVAGIDAMLERWRSRPPQADVDAKQEMADLSLCVVAKALFSEDMGREATVFAEATEVALREVFARAMSPIVVPNYVPTPSNLRLRRAVANMDATVRRIIAARRDSKERPQDLLSTWMEARDPETGSGMTEDQLRDECVTMFVAGHETCATALTWSLYLLATHPQAQEALRREVREVLGDRTPTADDLPRLRYARQVLLESLRLYPQPWILGRMADRDVELGGYSIPSGAFVAVATYAIHRSDALWPKPDTFDPERFAGDAIPAGFVAFGFGPRRCVGERFGTYEAQLVLSRVVQKYELTLRPGHKPVKAVGEVSLHPRGKVLLRLRPLQGEPSQASMT